MTGQTIQWQSLQGRYSGRVVQEHAHTVVAHCFQTKLLSDVSKQDIL